MVEEVFDRIATGDNKFYMEQLEDGRIMLTPAPDEVVQPGTAVNKALLQPIIDIVKIEDISSDFLKSKYSADGGAFQCYIFGVYKTAHGITGTLSFSPSQGNETGFLGKNFTFDINGNYASEITTTTSVVGITENGDYEWGIASIVGSKLHINLPSNHNTNAQMSFHYIYKGD